jgi:succinate dehydrogenase / fumarate reductase cytochrome b subunit
MTVYRWQYTMTLSILNRVTGAFLTVASLLFVYWLVSVSLGFDAYVDAQAVFAHPLTRLALVGAAFAYFFHMLNGIRHIVWDFGVGFERANARASGWFVFLLAAALTAATVLIVAQCIDGGAR